ncbi:sensor histidine kinase [Putridiphycobacter roseus]|uniref:histidine kinase n=1 Tax=Putridiphycobacter roseus TaxID=2219161 RepID=A0A2W1MWP0_9FLAO|nr:ATP-binding protein [Putridiphycobacter roseus]PZE16539.1 sensor histidine kinase [Putridiphycobacter roseus]
MSLIKKPIQVVLIASAILMVMVLVGLIGVSFVMEADIHLWVYIVFPLFVGVVALLLFYYFIERFINQEIKAIYRVISKKKNIKINPVKLNENVFQSLSETTAAWAETQQKQIENLEEQANFRREFLGNLAHELKTPVFSIQGYILTLLEGGLEDETVNRDFLIKASRGVDRITSVLDDLDNISRYEFNRFNLKLTKFDIVRLTKEVFDTTQSSAEEKNITLSLFQNYDPIMVSADKGKIGQVLINLISNSISYGIENGHTQIKFSKVSRKQLSVEIIDDGIGIEEEHFNRLFERFYRVEKSRARNLAGSGLGLPIVKHIMEAHQQSITVNSTVGEGSVFTFTLDLA